MCCSGCCTPRTRRAHEPGSRPDGWRRALTLGGAAWFAVVAVPFLRYPAKPPGVGSPDSLELRTRGYLAAIAIGLLGVTAPLRLASDLQHRHVAPSHRQLAVTGMRSR